MSVVVARKESRVARLFVQGGIVEAGVGLAVVILAAAWMGQNAFFGDLVLLVAMYSLIALGMYVPFIMAGALSMAYNAYFALGAYAVGIFGQHEGWPVLLAVPVGALLSVVTAVLLGLLTRKLSGFYLAVSTLLFGICFQRWLIDASPITGGSVGLGNIPRPDLFGVTVSRVQLLIAGMVLVWAIAVVLSRMRRSLFGINLRVQKEVPVAAEAAGTPTVTMTIVALAIGAFIAALGGSLFALVNRFLLPDSFGVHLVFLIFYMPLLGGIGSPWGAIVGAATVVALTQGLTFFQSTGSLVFALGVLLVMFFAPKGLLGAAIQGIRWLFRHSFEQSADRA